jgi:exodeoxyribonuclease VII large subunit
MTGFLWSDDADSFFGEPENKPSSSGKQTPGAAATKPLSVSQLNQWIKRTLDKAINTFWVAGEIGTLTQSGAGHVYLTIKDADSQISAVVWRSTMERLGIQLREGMAVLVQGKIDVYPPRGSYQIVVQKIEQQGLGALQIALRKLHKKLEAEGLFAPERKKSLPRFPSRIGFVTSPAGAAIHDFTQVLQRRWPNANILIIPAKVQGAESPEQITRGIQVAARIRPALDVLIVGRGGGSLEDLWSFNDETVVRAVADCPIPTISAVGHEIDVTLCDLAADVRAATPSEAAEIVAPDRTELLEMLSSINQRLTNKLDGALDRGILKLRSLESRNIFLEPERLLDHPTQRLDEAHRDIDIALDRRFEILKERFERNVQMIETLSPLKTLARGYSLTTDATTGTLITDANQLHTGQRIRTRLANGSVESTVSPNRGTSE